MSTVVTPSGETLEGVVGQLLDYYQGEANTVGGYTIDGCEYPRKIDAAESDFDPSVHNVAEVEEHLAESTEAEQERVLEAEAEGKRRKSLLGDETADS